MIMLMLLDGMLQLVKMDHLLLRVIEALVWILYKFYIKEGLSLI